MPEISRVDAGRKRASAAKRAVALTAVGGFVAVLGLARLAHPGAATAQLSHDSSSLPASPSSEQEQGFSLGGGSIGQTPSGTLAPQIQTQTS
jgi:hypothetical protein